MAGKEKPGPCVKRGPGSFIAAIAALGSCRMEFRGTFLVVGDG